MADERNKCGHEICMCVVGEGEEYCSEGCEAAGESDISEIACDCGHSGCDDM